MKDTLTFIVSAIVDFPQEVVIEERMEGETHVFSIKVDPKDMGKIIGKSGRIIRALRELSRILAAKQNAYVDLEVVESETVVI